MAYIIETESFGRKERAVDLHRFAADLAGVIGGTLRPVDDDRHFRRIQLAENDLHLSTSYQHKMRVVARMVAPEIAHDDRCYYAKEARTPEVTIDPERDLRAVARDLRRRAFEPAQEPLAKQRAFAAERIRERDEMRQRVEILRAAGFRVDWNERDNQCQVYSGAVYARMVGTAVEIQNLRDLTVDQFLTVAALLQSFRKEPTP